MNQKVGIVGYGWVGSAMHKLFPYAAIYSHNLVLHDGEWIKDPVAFKEDEAIYKGAINKCDIVFICVPTPLVEKDNEEKNLVKGTLDTTAVQEVIQWCEASILVVRSTVNPRDCARWKIMFRKHIIMQPEYLGETPQHPLLDTSKTPFLILGGDRADLEQLINLYTTVYNANVRIRQVTAYAAEIIKLCENRAISFKVAECQELYDTCKANDVDYYTVRDAVYGDDPRFNLWWTFVYPDKRGFNSKCIPKDVYAWCAWAESAGYDPKITKAILEKNKEWINHETGN